MPRSFLCSESNCDHVVQYGIHFDRLQWAGWSSANDTNSGYSVLVCLSLYFVFFILGECQFCCLKMKPTQHKVSQKSTQGPSVLTLILILNVIIFVSKLRKCLTYWASFLPFREGAKNILRGGLRSSII